MSEAYTVLQGQAAVSSVLLRCFGREGDLTVVVPRSAGDEPEQREGIRVEFKVWSMLLSEWSDVIAAMLSHNCRERASAELEIIDFSSDAVETFLRFMYSGTVGCSKDILIEVAGLADKYNVTQLQKLCKHEVEKVLTAESAWEMLQFADRVGAVTIKQGCLDAMLLEPHKALPPASGLAPHLLEEVLTSSILCISDIDLLTILIKWGCHGAVAPERISDLVHRHVRLDAVTEDEFKKAVSLAETAGCAPSLKKIKRACKRGRRTDDVFSCLWSMYMTDFPDETARPSFIGYWILLIPSVASFGKANTSTQLVSNVSVRRDADNLRALRQLASNQEDMMLAANQEMVWMLPNHTIYLTGLSFNSGVDSTHVEVLVSTDGMQWSCILDSATHKDVNHKGGTVIACRLVDCARWFKLRVHSGRYSNRLRVHGVIQVLGM